MERFIMILNIITIYIYIIYNDIFIAYIYIIYIRNSNISQLIDSTKSATFVNALYPCEFYLQFVIIS